MEIAAAQNTLLTAGLEVVQKIYPAADLKSIFETPIQRVYLIRHLKSVQRQLPRRPHNQDNTQTVIAYHNALKILLAKLKQM